jgi:hypothetical protein
MMGMMGSAPSPVAPDQLSVLRGLARLLDPAADVQQITAALPRADVRQAIETMGELFDLIQSLTPLDATLSETIADLQQREVNLAEREAKLARREAAIAAVLANFKGDDQ